MKRSPYFKKNGRKRKREEDEIGSPFFSDRTLLTARKKDFDRFTEPPPRSPFNLMEELLCESCFSLLCARQEIGPTEAFQRRRRPVATPRLCCSPKQEHKVPSGAGGLEAPGALSLREFSRRGTRLHVSRASIVP